ncbi:sulfotransferase [Actinomadura craniellae]|uniref:Sulfotransferase n=1 Tax=Actinomadura craniellae TaxID=2231787 RepID=A0A365HDX2_9ACTN|nr:sulfotransferase [Actinomadura craniellae]
MTANGDRLLAAPVFLMSSVRSGSTLLRVIIDGHSAMHAPHELHLRDLKVDLHNDYVARSMAGLGLSERELEHLLWDRVLHRELMSSGKQILVNKSPDDLFMWRRIAGCWRDARFVFLLRHPGAVLASWWRARPRYSEDEAVESVRRYMTALEEARTELPGHVVRYEELTADPESVCQDLCRFIGVDWEPKMLEYGLTGERNFEAGLGDWSARIKSGRVQPGTPPPADVPKGLRDFARAWGY